MDQNVFPRAVKPVSELEAKAPYNADTTAFETGVWVMQGSE